MCIKRKSRAQRAGVCFCLQQAVIFALLHTFAASVYAATPQVIQASATALEVRDKVRLVAVDAESGTAVFSTDKVLHSVERGQTLRGVPLRLIHVREGDALIELTHAGRVARLSVAIGATVPLSEFESQPALVPLRTFSVSSSQPASPGQSADADASNP